jgi:RNA polymerase sigma-70 factor (ECF subfamily)
MALSTPTHADVARLLMKHHTSLYAYIYACVRSHHDAEDILQSVSVVIMEQLDQLRDEDGFLPWAREIARRCTLAHWRRVRREKALDPDLLQALAEAADAVEREEPTSLHRDALTACLDGLPPDSRRLLAMRYDGSAVGDLARCVGRTVQSVYAQLKRIKSALRDCVRRRLAAEAVR